MQFPLGGLSSMNFKYAPGGPGTELLVILLFVLILFVILLVDSMTRRSRRRFRFPYRSPWFKQRQRSESSWFNQRKRPDSAWFNQQQRSDLTDFGQQLRAVMAGSFEKQRLLSNSEYRVFSIVENEIAAQGAGYRVFAQTSLGEILRSSNEDAFHSINSKRVDILVVDRAGWPFLAIEHQGDGHYQGTAAARDAIKKEALRKAGVRYLEFSATDTDDQIRSRLREQFAVKVAGSAKMFGNKRTTNQV